MAVEVLVESEPTNMYENSGLIWYYDDDNYTILTKEKIGADILVHLFSERDGKPGTAFHKKVLRGISWLPAGDAGSAGILSG